MKRQLSVFEQLRRACTRYGVVPEDIGPVNTFTDEEYMSGYLWLISRWEPPSAYGCTQRHRERARKAWAKVFAEMRANEAEERVRVNRSPTARPLESGGQAIHVKSEDERDDSNS